MFCLEEDTLKEDDMQNTSKGIGHRKQEPLEQASKSKLQLFRFFFLKEANSKGNKAFPRALWLWSNDRFMYAL